MAQSHEVLNHVTLSRAVNEMKDPLSFIKNTFFGRDVTVPTRHIEASVIRRGRKIAPLVKRDGAAIMTEGRTEEMYPVMPAHIRTKRAMTPSDLLETRRAGNVIHLTDGDQSEAMAAYMADELTMQMDDHTNTEEYLAAMSLRGAYTYEAADEVSLEVDFDRPAAHDVVLTGSDLWTATTSNPDADIDYASSLTEEEVGLVITDGILGFNAAQALLKNEKVLKTLLESRRLVTGQIDLTTVVQQNGARYLGTLSSGVRLWSYNRTVQLPASAGGGSVKLIRDDYVEFIANSPMNEWVTYYGAIEDMKAIGAGKVLQAKRFSKSWEVEDPSARMLLVESNPLPFMGRPGASVSMKVS